MRGEIKVVEDPNMPTGKFTIIGDVVTVRHAPDVVLMMNEINLEMERAIQQRSEVV